MGRVVQFHVGGVVERLLLLGGHDLTALRTAVDRTVGKEAGTYWLVNRKNNVRVDVIDNNLGSDGLDFDVVDKGAGVTCAFEFGCVCTLNALSFSLRCNMRSRSVPRCCHSADGSQRCPDIRR